MFLSFLVVLDCLKVLVHLELQGNLVVHLFQLYPYYLSHQDNHLCLVFQVDQIPRVDQDVQILL